MSWISTLLLLSNVSLDNGRAHGQIRKQTIKISTNIMEPSELGRGQSVLLAPSSNLAFWWLIQLYQLPSIWSATRFMMLSVILVAIDKQHSGKTTDNNGKAAIIAFLWGNSSLALMIESRDGKREVMIYRLNRTVGLLTTTMLYAVS
jgi:hypothetical protein